MPTTCKVVLLSMPVLCTGVALDPDAGAVCIMLFFPDGNCGFDRVDDSAAGVEGGIAMGGGDGDADREFTDLKVTGAVLAAGGYDIVVFANFLDDTLAFFFRKGRKGFIF